MATTFVSTSSDFSSGATSLSPSVPASVQDDDLLLAIVTLNVGQSISSAPSGWVSLGNSTSQESYLYWKLASSESGSYTWSWATTCKCRIQVAAYRSGFNTGDPIDAVSNTDYTTFNTVLRAASFSVTSDNSTLIFAGYCDSTSSKTFTPPSNPGTFTEDVDAGETTSDNWITFAHFEWSSSGSTGDVDATISANENDKHAFCVSLNPSSIAYDDTLNPGSFSYSGTNKSDDVTKEDDLNPGSFSFAGASIDADYSGSDDLNPGSFSYSGTNKTDGFFNDIGSGSFSFTGSSMEDGYVGIDDLNPGSFSYSGTDKSGSITNFLDAGSFSFTGASIEDNVFVEVPPIAPMQMVLDALKFNKLPEWHRNYIITNGFKPGGISLRLRENIRKAQI
jgi:hypothetical protein